MMKHKPGVKREPTMIFQLKGERGLTAVAWDDISSAVIVYGDGENALDSVQLTMKHGGRVDLAMTRAESEGFMARWDISL